MLIHFKSTQYIGHNGCIPTFFPNTVRCSDGLTTRRQGVTDPQLNLDIYKWVVTTIFCDFQGFSNINDNHFQIQSNISNISKKYIFEISVRSRGREFYQNNIYCKCKISQVSRQTCSIHQTSPFAYDKCLKLFSVISKKTTIIFKCIQWLSFTYEIIFFKYIETK